MGANEIEIDRVVIEYARAYSELWKQVQLNQSEFPGAVISCGTVGEYYSRIYLRHRFPESAIRFGAPNERGWDIEVSASSESRIRFQVKVISTCRKTRVISALVTGFDQLIILCLDGMLFPIKAFLFEDSTVFRSPTRIRTLTVPDSTKARSGSGVFTQAKDISREFWDALE